MSEDPTTGGKPAFRIIGNGARGPKAAFSTTAKQPEVRMLFNSVIEATLESSEVAPFPSSMEGEIIQTPPPPRQSSPPPSGEVETSPSVVAARLELERMTNELDSACARVVAQTVELARERAFFFQRHEQELLELAVAIARAILDVELSLHPAAHQAMVRSAVAAIDAKRHVVVRASPESYEALLTALRDVRNDIGGVEIELVVDNAQQGFGCIVESEDMRANAGVAERLAEVRAAILADHKNRIGREEAPDA